MNVSDMVALAMFAGTIVFCVGFLVGTWVDRKCPVPADVGDVGDVGPEKGDGAKDLLTAERDEMLRQWKDSCARHAVTIKQRDEARLTAQALQVQDRMRRAFDPVTFGQHFVETTSMRDGARAKLAAPLPDEIASPRSVLINRLRAERNALIEEIWSNTDAIVRRNKRIATLEAERGELLARLNNYPVLDIIMGTSPLNRIADCVATRLTAERDEARAEVDRLKCSARSVPPGSRRSSDG